MFALQDIALRCRAASGFYNDNAAINVAFIFLTGLN
jgi:hypothetical protein